MPMHGRHSPAYVLSGLLALCAGTAACGTLASPPGSGENLPSSGVGPFRPLARSEMPPFAAPPFVLDDSGSQFREPSVVAANGDGNGPGAGEPAVLLYAVARVGGRDVIVRTRAGDARSFYGSAADNETGAHPAHSPAVVLAPDGAWEGGDLSGPSALRVGSRVWLYYAGAGGIGLATSDDGLTFVKTGQPVLGPDARVAWETTPPHAPSVARMPDGSWRMFYGAGRSIGEAASTDGVAWTRIDAQPQTSELDPVLSTGASFDSGQVDDPVVLPRVTPAGRLQVRMLYTGYDAPPGGGSQSAPRSSAIGFAARYGEAGPFARQAVPVYSAGAHDAAPAWFEYARGSILYVQQDETALDPSNPYTAIAAGVAPESTQLSAAGPFSSMP
jgi:hypothetical protein